MSNYPDNFTGTPYDIRPLRGDDLDEALELASDYDALFAIDEARTAYRAAIAAQKKNLSDAGQRMLAAYLIGDEDNYHDSSLQGHLQEAAEIDL
jgi:hypothetical protein